MPGKIQFSTVQHCDADKLRTATLSPQPSAKQGKTSNTVTFSNSKNAIQRSSKRINYLKNIVKRQQQKSLSRDFTNALMNTNISHPGLQLSLFKSQGGASMNSTLNNKSQSPSRHQTSSQKKKKKVAKKKKDDLAQSV